MRNNSNYRRSVYSPEGLLLKIQQNFLFPTLLLRFTKKKIFGLSATSVELRCTCDTYLVIVKKKTQKAQSKTDIKNSDKLANIHLYCSHL